MDTLLAFLAGTMDKLKLSLDDTLGSVPEHSADCRGICVERYEVDKGGNDYQLLSVISRRILTFIYGVFFFFFNLYTPYGSRDCK